MTNDLLLSTAIKYQSQILLFTHHHAISHLSDFQCYYELIFVFNVIFFFFNLYKAEIQLNINSK